MTVIFDEIVGEITPDSPPSEPTEPPQPTGGAQDSRAAIRALARERWKQNRLRAD
ncbi:MAG: hypothetical protein AAF637_03250 [Pseudomonadota bacterium]